MNKKRHKCYRCKNEYEKVYLIPYLTIQFIDVTICRNCSMEFHKEIKEFTEKFLCQNVVLPIQ